MAEWVEYKSQLLRAYFSVSNPLAAIDSPFHKEFCAFLNRFEAKTCNLGDAKIKAAAKLDNTMSTRRPTTFNAVGAPEGGYDKYFVSNVTLGEKMADKLLLRNIPSTAIREFDYIIQLYYKFRNSKYLKRLKKLKESQKGLPIFQNRCDILECLQENQIVIIAGDTGCGKSTQLPQYLLNAGFSKIACTQPRRIACTALAQRVALEMLKQFDSEIAYQTRFDKTRTSSTKMLFLTEGVLLRQMVSDPDLQRYDIVILDEVHERNISADLLVALLRGTCQRRNDIKLILMSATINIDLFKSYFQEAPVISVPGRLHPIELRYLPPLIREVDPNKKSARIDPGPYVNILQLIDKKHTSKERGDVLVFLNGISEITIVADACKEYAEFSKRWIVLILHSTLSVEEQQKVFDLAPTGLRKCILSTNIAETSLTIDEIRFVIDSGKENLMVYDAIVRTHKLTETWISKASANQRKGRAGRTGPGMCFRLYSEEEFTKMEDFTLPEIKRVALDSLIIQILDMNLHIDVREFPFLERPEIGPLNETLESLKSQGVVDARNEKFLSPLGMILAKLPVDVSISKMLIYSCVLNQLDVCLTIAAGLSVQSPFTNRSFREPDCIYARQHLLSDIGDPFTLIRVYREWLRLRQEGSEDTRKWTRRLGIEEARLFEINKLRKQFREILEQNELIPKQQANEMSELSSKERRVLVGEKRKLYDLKKRAGYEGKRAKVLKEGQHFDTIMDRNKEDEAHFLANSQEQIQHLEFSILTSGKEMERELGTHRLNEAMATLLKLILATGLYPQYAVVDPTNNFREGHDQFAHTPTKPFVVLHPNSALGQKPDVLRIDVDSEGRSCQHQFIYYGLLLETTKPFLCNSSRIPANFLLVAAKNITCTSPIVVCCDGFIEFHFLQEHALEETLEMAMQLRAMFMRTIELKLSSNEYGNSSDLLKKIIIFSRLKYEFSLRRRINPPKHLNYGVFSPTGEEHPLMKSIMFENFVPTLPLYETEEDDIGLEDISPEKTSARGKQYFCENCDKTFWFENNLEILKHKKKHQ